MSITEYGSPQDCYPFIIAGEVSQTPVQAWESFQVTVEKDFKWIRGYKYWRAIPEIFKHKDFGSQETVYLVRARCFSLEDKHETYKEATANEPYHLYKEMIYDNDDMLTGFGLAEKKEQK